MKKEVRENRGESERETQTLGYSDGQWGLKTHQGQTFSENPLRTPTHTHTHTRTLFYGDQQQDPNHRIKGYALHPLALGSNVLIHISASR